MFKSKILNFILFIAIVASLFLSASVPVQAQSVGSGQAKIVQKEKDKKEKKIKQKDREAAAARAFQQGALNPLMVNAQAADLYEAMHRTTSATRTTPTARCRQ